MQFPPPGMKCRRISSMSRLAVLPVVLLAMACSDLSGPASGAVPPDRLASMSAVSQDSTPSQLAVADAVPGFGGYFLDESGAPTVYLTDASQRPAAEQALAAFLESREFTAADLRVRQAQYSYAQLDSWYRAARNSVFSVAGIATGDVDEASNTLRFGVTDAGAVAEVQAALAQVGVPTDAAVVQQRPAIVAMNTLRSRVRPIIGGLQINFFPTPPGLHPGSLLCTLGFNAIKDGVGSFITNSHCSNVEGGTETPTDYYQATRSAVSPNFIATEADDPHWTIGTSLDCPPPFACRYSDAARARYAPGIEFTLGRIARVDEVTTSLSDTLHTIDGHFTIKGEQSRGVVGEIANKVGRTTGWSLGPTTATCVDVLALGTTHIRLCQEFVTAFVAGGDSGSNVFRRAKGPSNVILLGLLWGGSTDESNPEFVYSPMSGIERELGELTTR